MSHDIVPRCVATSFHVSGPAVRLVVTRRVQGELPDQLAVLGDHPDLKAVDQDEDPRPDQPATEPDVVQLRVVADRHHPGDVDLVPPDPEPPRDRKADVRR